MELTKKQVSITKGVAILFMLLLHLFCTKDYQGLFTPLIHDQRYSTSLLSSLVWGLLCSNLLFLQRIWTYVYIQK